MDPSRRRSSITAPSVAGSGSVARRTSSGGTGAASGALGASGIPRFGASRTGINRAQQGATYDIITGAEHGRPVSREGYRASNHGGHSGGNALLHSQARRMSVSARDNLPSTAGMDVDTTAIERLKKDNADLKAELNALKYTLDSRKQEDELAKLRVDSEMREVRRKAEEDFKARQAAEAERNRIARVMDGVAADRDKERQAWDAQRQALEKQLKEANDREATAREDEDVATARADDAERLWSRKMEDATTRTQTLERECERLAEAEGRLGRLLRERDEAARQHEKQLGEVEAEVLRLRAQTGDADTLGVIKRELSEQVTHIRSLEQVNREQGAELKHLRRVGKSIEVVEEEKRTLERRLEASGRLELELGEAKIQVQRLQDEKLAWTAYLRSQAGEEGNIEFETPEDLARALVQQRAQSASLVERIGLLEAEVLEKHGQNDALRAEKSNLDDELARLKLAGPGESASVKTSSSGDSKVRMRLERQRALAVKEVEYLRAQLKTFDTEDMTFQPEKVDEARMKRVQELEDMVDKYRAEVQALQTELSTMETLKDHIDTGSKRPLPDAVVSEDGERVGQLTRKNRKLQDSLTQLQSAHALLQKEVDVTRKRLDAAAASNSTRVLALRSNPTSDFEAIKASTLKALQQENADLLAVVQSQSDKQSRSSVPTVPVSALTACQRDIQTAQDELASEQKRNARLKTVWLAKSREFRELVVSLLGWDVVFLPNGQMRVTSFYYPARGEAENSIVFDGERGTMKVSGGRQSAFQRRIADQIAFWVDARVSIPCFLAALTLEFWEERDAAGGDHEQGQDEDEGGKEAQAAVKKTRGTRRRGEGIGDVAMDG